jgi:ligand-binding sensor domain-containing protein
MMLRNWLLIGLLVLFLCCKTGEIDEIVLLNEEVNFEISNHLYPGINIKALTIVGTDHWFYASGSIITEVKTGQETFHTATSEVISMAWNKTDATLWFGTRSSGLANLKNGLVTYFTKESHGLLRTEFIRNVTYDNEGGVWFNSSAHMLGRLGYYKNGQFTFYTPENSTLPDNLVKSIAISGNTVYVATGGTVTQQKVVKITEDRWELLPITGYYLMGMTVDRNNVVFVIDDYSLSSSFINSTFIIVYDGQKIQNLAPESSSGLWYHPYLLVTDHRNYLWVVQFSSTTIKNLQVYNGKQWFEPETFPDDFIQCIAFDNKNTAWVGTNNGIYLLEQ